MAIVRTKLKPGDVLQISSGSDFAYLHYLGKHQKYGGAVAVKPNLHEAQALFTNEFFADSYVTFYPATAAFAHGLVKVVGHLPPVAVPTTLRRAGRRVDRRVETWIIEDGSREVVRGTLSDDELRLPIAGIWNHDYLMQRIAEGWNPVNCRDRT